jgi:tetratricopeptide (TPR) repeat protein
VLPAIRDRGVLSSDLDALLLETLQNCLWDPDAEMSAVAETDSALDLPARAALASLQNLTGGARDLVLSATTLDRALGFIFRDKLFRAFLRQNTPADGLSAVITAVSALADSAAPPQPVARLSQPPPSRLDTAQIEAIAGLPADAIVHELLTTGRADLTRAVMTALHRKGAFDTILTVAEAFSSDASTAAGGAYARLYFARTMLAMNAAETAYGELEALLALPDLSTQLDAADISVVTHHAARAALRSGRPARAEALWRQDTVRQPTHWENYLHLAYLADANGPLTRVMYLELAERLAARFPPEGYIALAEALLEEGRPVDALTRALLGMKRHLAAPELLVALANVHRSLGAPQQADAYLERFFQSYDLPTALGVTRAAGGHVLDRFRKAQPSKPVTGDKRVTVIMTTFNSAATIQQALASVLAQSYENIRVVVVDDVSTDATVEILHAIANRDHRISVRISSENRGTYFAKNSAMKEFASDYYAFHDSDDWMHPDHILKHLEVMQASPQLACTLSQWFRMDEAGVCIARRGGGYLHDNPASTFFPQSVVRDLGYFDAVRTGADSEFTWRIRRRYGAQSVQTIRAPLSIGLHHAQSLTTRGVAAFDEHRFSPVRLSYWESWMAWHRATGADTGRLFTPHPLLQRAFAAPEEIDANLTQSQRANGEHVAIS